MSDLAWGVKSGEARRLYLTPNSLLVNLTKEEQLNYKNHQNRVKHDLYCLISF